MMVLLEFIIDTGTLVDCCRDEWLKMYDKEVHLNSPTPSAAAGLYLPRCWSALRCCLNSIVDGLLANIFSFQPELQQLLKQLSDQVHLTAQASEAEASKFSG